MWESLPGVIEQLMPKLDINGVHAFAGWLAQERR
jgi:hypothetical protein